VSWTDPFTGIDAEEGVTCTDATGPGVTVRVAEPDLPSLVAVIVVVPTSSPVATPVVDTVATVGSLDAQVTVRPVSTLPFASFNVAVKFVVAPLETLVVAGATVTVATGARVTVTVADPDFPSLVAVMVAVPGVTPVTTPVLETVAIAVALDAHVTTRLVTTVPLTSLTTAVSVVVPRTTTVGFAGDTVTLPTGAIITVTDAVPDFPSLVAVIVTVPGETPVTTPTDDTVATVLLLDVHVTARSVTTVPIWSFTVAVSVVVCPVMTLAVAGVTVTLATGSAITVTVDVPLFPSLVAVMVAVPPDAPVTTPVLETVATAALLELHETTRSVTTVPFASLTVATSVVVSPSLTFTVAGETVTLPTGTAATVTAEVPDLPSLVAVIVTEPAATPVTTPVADTVASAVLLDVHVTVRPVSTTPFASFTVAVKVVV
jgi:hypothetical protein